MASSSKQPLNLLILIISIFPFFITTLSSSTPPPTPTPTPTPTTNTTLSSTYNQTHLQAIHFACKSTPYPNICFNSLKLSISINIPPNILNLILQSLQNSINEATKLSSLLFSIHNDVVETQKGALQDCKDLHQISLFSLQKSVSRVKSSKLSDARAFLSAALTNKATCLEGLASATGPRKPMLVNSIIGTYKYVSNSIAMLTHQSGWDPNDKSNEILGSYHRRLLGILGDYNNSNNNDDDDNDNIDDNSVSLVVAMDGSGNFTNVQDAVNFAPNNSEYRIFIYVKQGVYNENVVIPSSKTNIVLLGDGSDATIITGNRSVGDGWTTFRSATVAVSGEGFLARGITFENSAGAAKHQAVALRINADLAAIYRCTIVGYQDSLYVHSFRQFYRECDIYGTVDYIFGNAAVVFQACNIISRMPLPGQFTVITAQSRDLLEENTGISIQNCSILATDDLYGNKTSVKSFLGRPWKEYSTTVYMESYIDDFIHPLGWTKWDGDRGLKSLYYGEYDNTGPGSNTSSRVDWEGYHVMSYEDAANYTVSQFIVGDEWLDSTSFPYDNDL